MCLSIRWICTKSKFDLCHTCNTELATQQLDAKQAEAEKEAKCNAVTATEKLDAKQVEAKTEAKCNTEPATQRLDETSC